MSEENTNIQSIGNIKISEEAVAIVAGVAATEVNGVSGMCATIAGGIAELLGKKSFAKGVKVEITEQTVFIAISLVVQYGSKIPDVAWEVQEKVKHAVESMTGLEVTAVDVFVNGIDLPKLETSEA